MNVLPDNVPQKVFEEAKSLLNKLLGPALEESGAILGDRIRIFRFEKQLKLLRKTLKILEEQRLQPKKVNMKVLLPLLDSAALEEDEEMSDRWASLLASAAE